MQTELFLLDLLGTLAFAIYGSYFALKKNFDLFGIFVCAFLTAVGGGSIRDMFLNEFPVYFSNYWYFIIILLGMGIALLAYHNFHRIKKFVLVLDSLGLVTFAFIGASKASSLHLGMGAIIFFAVLTAVGGGVLRDIVLNKVPEIMYRDFYATVALLLGAVYSFFSIYMENIFWANILLLSFFFLRIIILIFDIHLWKPKIIIQNTLQK